jgi:glycosyltransferase involved in cell wall biosynthesis
MSLPHVDSPTVAIIGTRGYPSYYGGFETLVRQLAPYLASQGWGVTVYGRSNEFTPDDHHQNEGVTALSTPGINSRMLSTLSYGLSSSLHACMRPPSVALVMNVANGFWLPLLRRRNIPSVVNVDGIEWQRSKWGASAKKVFHTGAVMTAKYADSLIFDSEAIGDIWRRDFGAAGIFIPYGSDAPPADIPVSHNLRHRGYILFVARFVPENSVDLFFSSAQVLSQSTDVVIVGSTGFGGSFDRQAAELAAKHPRIRWYGHVSDDLLLSSLWHHAGAYFHGHTVGGTNPALVQAMASGAPTIAVDTPFNREVLGDAGLFVEPSSGNIIRSLDSLMKSPSSQESLSSAGRERAARRYSWEKVCRQYLKCLSDAATSNSTVKRTHLAP